MSDKAYQTVIDPTNTTQPAEFHIRFAFRWPVVQVDTNQIEVLVPRGWGCSVLDREFIDLHKLSYPEIHEATEAVIRAVAIVK